MTSSFGRGLRKLRDERGLSLRELEQLSGVDHAYIQRLETGEKEAPSDEVLQKLLRALKAGPRKSQILQMVIGKEINPELLDLALDDPDLEIETFNLMAHINLRGKPDWRKLIKDVAKLRKEYEGG